MCKHPLKGFKVGTTSNGKDDICVTSYDIDYVVVHHDGHIERCRGEPFNSLYRHPQDKLVSDFIELPCGKCIDCRIKYSKAWADRCMLEASYYDSNYFITLTYDDAHLPFSSYVDNGVIKQAPTLALRDVQLFLKRLRKQGYKFRYFMCGEYGSNTLRPHYHICFFGLKIDDLQLLKKSKHGFDYYISDSISNIWNQGFIIITPLTWETCAYTARYCLKKVNNNLTDFYEKYNVIPEFITMSRNPGIARQYYDEHKADIYEHDELHIATSKGSRKRRPPRYFDKIFEEEFPDEFEKLKENRAVMAEELKRLKLEQTDLNYLDMLAVEEQDLIRRTHTLVREL